jgi:RNA polymerase sigma-70 factor (ECF subfamily)
MEPAPPDGEAAEAFTRYVVPELDVLYRVALSLTRHPADAQDLVQDTLLRAYRAIDRFDGRHPRAWLLTILRNTHRNRQRARRPELFHDPDEALAHLASAEPGAGDAADAAMAASFDAVVEAALRDLPEQQRRVVGLVDIDGLTYEEAATVLEVPVGTVMSRLHRARRRLRSRLIAAGVTRRRPQ